MKQEKSSINRKNIKLKIAGDERVMVKDSILSKKVFGGY